VRVLLVCGLVLCVLPSCRLFSDGAACEPDNPATCPAGTVCAPSGVCVVAEDATLCGNGTVDPGEACDDGNADNRDACHTDCTVPACGDGFTDVGEACDDGNDIDTDVCTNACTVNGAPVICGDGQVGGAEDCDFAAPGAATCTPRCTFNICGDGFVLEDEACDDGDDDSDDGCDADPDGGSCTFASCGDGRTSHGEACDFSNSTDPAADRCRSDCTEQQRNDGIVDPDEACDDGNDVDTDGCIATVLARCGDGVVRTTGTGIEACEPTVAGVSDANCNADCTAPRCGDRILNVDAGEQCEGNDLTRCDANCQLVTPPVTCGNGQVDNGEGCDYAVVNGGACTPSCTLPDCGNTILEPGESCDDGDDVNGDGCSAGCRVEFCGDGATNNGEVCDATDPSGRPCTPSCELAGCGNDRVDPGEACDGDVDCTDECRRFSSCSAILAARPEAPTGTYVIEPLDTPRTVTCDMEFQGGGWTLIMATMFFGPETVAFNDQAISGVPSRLGVRDVAALARSSGQVHIRAEGQAATRSMTSVPGSLPIVRLAQGATLSPLNQKNNDRENIFFGSTEWSGPLASSTDGLICPPTQGYPQILHTCGNSFGTHLLGGVSTLTRVGAENEAVEVYVRAGPRCGDGRIDPGELCDDGNGLDGDGCNTTCRPSCGDGDVDRVVTIDNPAVSPLGETIDNRMRALVGAGDLNRDGRPDLVITQIAGLSRIAVAVSHPRGLQRPLALMQVPNFFGVTSAPMVGDVTGDGDADVVAFSATDTGCVFTVAAGNGEGGLVVSSPPAPSVERLNTACRGGHLVDLDGDRDLDVIFAAINTDRLEVFINDGSGAFGSGSSIPTGLCRPHAVRSGDVNGDGDEDLIVACTASGTDGGLRVLPRVGNGFGAAIAVGPRAVSFNVVVGDINGDRFADLVTQQGDTTVVALGAGDPTTGSVLSFSIQGGEDAAIGDVDGDGDNDVVVGRGVGRTEGEVLLRNVTRPGKRLNLVPESAAASVDAGSPALVDLNGDGVLDIVTVRHNTAVLNGVIDNGAVEGCDDGNAVATDSCDFCQARCTGAQSAAVGICFQSIASTFGGDDGPFANVADFYGDGVQDTMVGAINGTTVTLAVGSRRASPTFRALSVETEPQGQSAGDLDEDGLTDIISVNTGVSAITLHYGKSDGSFGSNGDLVDYRFLDNVLDGGFVEGATLADLDGDGHLDAVSFSTRVRVHYGDGTRNTAVWPTADLITDPQNEKKVESLAVGDVEGASGGDGDLDLVIFTATERSIRLLRNDGARAFTPVSIVTLGFDATLSLGDVDTDGDVDIVLSAGTSGLHVMVNTGAGAFEAPRLLPVSDASQAVVADMDRDGKNDLVVARGSSDAGGGLTVLFGGATLGALGTRRLNFGNGGTSCVAAPDFDGDGDHDVVACQTLGVSRVIVAYENR
jgi:cysteine-rich repeat protein